MKIKLFNHIDEDGLKTFGSNYQISSDLTDEDAILVRSANLLELDMNANLKAIARAGAGVNNIPIDECSKKGIVVFNTPGANANAVKELTICALFLSSRNIINGNEWVKTITGDDYSKQVEAGKTKFVGNEVYDKKLGVIGLGNIGSHVANTAINLGMEVLGYDPYISINNAWALNMNIEHITNLNDVLSSVDYLTIHVPSVKENKAFINENTISKMKDGVKIINFSRGDLVDEDALINALNSGKVSCYISDFGSERLNKNEKAIILPHLGASTVESEQNCALMAAKELKDYLENGNIFNSVNMPSIVEPMSTTHRITIIHKNIPNMLAQFATVIGSHNINIENMFNKAKGEYAYTMIDTNDEIDSKYFTDITDVIKVRIIEKN